jgi:hypothetical protein
MTSLWAAVARPARGLRRSAAGVREAHCVDAGFVPIEGPAAGAPPTGTACMGTAGSCTGPIPLRERTAPRGGPQRNPAEFPPSTRHGARQGPVAKAVANMASIPEGGRSRGLDAHRDTPAPSCDAAGAGGGAALARRG